MILKKGLLTELEKKKIIKKNSQKGSKIFGVGPGRSTANQHFLRLALHRKYDTV